MADNKTAMTNGGYKINLNAAIPERLLRERKSWDFLNMPVGSSIIVPKEDAARARSAAMQSQKNKDGEQIAKFGTEQVKDEKGKATGELAIYRLK